ncbi:hypothetical protein DFA_07325 [Cavenderia fasciculata]|uniref:Uncharacterized protein n=1 Tax=Cavenderia fasciculata TaxID=261658 RepID=F4PW41_CACFS|nr:uncharacterized protein DFA_07325 [Cavenderia fasciculata]EGG20205.1 hypothetical protein DFA_07325 [Cavenderia fasciculata]|eukprot:XP_004367188.1 hypothetical protein DFA_07325 [Cavenderia fasciculata]
MKNNYKCLVFIFIAHFVLVSSSNSNNDIKINIKDNNNNQYSVDQFSSSGTLTPPEYDINYQIHSWNDLDEWHQMYRKGVVWNKVDLHYMSPEYCIDSSGRGNPLGCFILSHDIPSPLTVQYNTSIDLLAWITGEGSNYYGTDSSTIKHMALCFKLDKLGACDLGSSAFRSLLIELMSNITSLQENGVAPNLRFLLDGNGVPLNCLSQSLQPYNATWVGKPWDARNDNNASLGYDRLVVADLPIDSLVPDFWPDVMCSRDTPYFKFLNGQYPVLVWEPSDQRTIQSVASTYVGCMSLHNTLQFPQLLFASNIDPAQFQSYLATTSSNHSWNIHLNEQNSYGVTIKSKIVVYTLTDGMQYHIVLSSNSTTSNYSYGLLISKGIHGQVEQVGSYTLEMLDGKIDTIVSSSIIYNVDGQDYLYIYDNLGGYIIYSIDTTTQYLGFTPIVFGVLQADTQDLFVSSSLEYLSHDASTNTLQMLQYFSTDSCALGSTVWNISLTPGQYYLQLSPVTCLVSNINIDSKSFIITPSTTISSVTTSNSHTSDNTTFTNCLYDSIVVFSSKHSILSNVIMGGHVCILHNTSYSHGSQYYNISLQSNLVVLDTGVTPSMSIAYNPTDSKPHFMMVHGGGYCYNTEIHNKRSSPRVCESTPTPSIDSQVLNYIYGRFDDLLAHIYNDTGNQINYISSCDRHLVRGVYNHGSNPSTTLFVTTDQDQQPTLGVIALHQGVSPTYLDMSICGSPIPFNGLILNSWSIFPNLLD